MVTATRKSRIRRPRRTVLIALAAVVLLLFLSASWILGYRLMNDPGNSFFTIGYVGDEYIYAQRMQPLVAGATETNPVNGLGDDTILSPFFLEDAVRAFLNLTGLDVVTFIWIWRWLFPLAASLAFLPLVIVAIPDRHRPWTQPLRLAAWGASLALLYMAYDAVTEFPPLQGFIQRVPTNIEYPLSFLMAAATISFLRKPDNVRAVLVGICGILLIYLRLYAAVPWAMTIGVILVLGLIKRELPWKPALLACIIVTLGALPWMYISYHNAKSPVFQEMFTRYFLKMDYSRHKQWALMLWTAQTIGLLAYLTPRWRTYMLGCVACLVTLPFACGLPSIRSEMLLFDRFGVFYLVALLSCALLWIGHKQQEWRGKSGARQASGWTHRLLFLGGATALVLLVRNDVYPLSDYPLGPLKYVQADLKYVPAYNWLRDHSAPEAMVLVDNGQDWGELHRQGRIINEWQVTQGERDDLFMIVARRRVAYSYRLYGMAVSNQTYDRASVLFLGTFGLDKETPINVYSDALRNITPDYVFWRKTAPVPRGYGVKLKLFSKTVYSDDVSEIWRLDKKRLLAALQPAVSSDDQKKAETTPPSPATQPNQPAVSQP